MRNFISIVFVALVANTALGAYDCLVSDMPDQIETIVFDEGAEIVVTSPKPEKTAANIVIIKSVAKNIWVSLDKTNNQYTMRYIPMKEFIAKQELVRKSLSIINKTIGEVLLSSVGMTSQAISIKYP